MLSLQLELGRLTVWLGLALFRWSLSVTRENGVWGIALGPVNTGFSYCHAVNARQQQEATMLARKRKPTVKPRRPRRQVGVFESDDIVKMGPVQFLRFCIDTLEKADLSRVVHGVVIQDGYEEEDNEGELYQLVHGLCGCAIGTIALNDGKTAQAALKACGSSMTSTRDWIAGTFAGWVLAGVSRVFEREGQGLATEEERTACVGYLKAVLTAVNGGRPVDEPYAFHYLDKDFGSLQLISD